MAEVEMLSSREPGQRGSTLPPLPPDALIIVPVRNIVLFPGMVLPITLGRPSSIAAAQQAVREQRQVGILMQRDAELADPSPIDLHRIGTVANIVRYVTAPDGTHHLVCQGEQRFRVVEFLTGWPFFVARVVRIPEPDTRTPEIEARFLNLQRRRWRRSSFCRRRRPNLLPPSNRSTRPRSSPTSPPPTWTSRPRRSRRSSRRSTSPRAWTRSRACSPSGSRCCGCRRRSAGRPRPRSTSASARCCCASRWRRSSASSARATGKAAEIAELDEAIAKADMPKEVEDQARKELRRLERMPEAAAEYGMVRTYLDWLIELPWALPEEKPIDIAEARRILDEDHYGLDKIKRRIVEYLAVRKLAPDGKAPILCFVGPPGVGKTSLGQSIARAMDRKFVRVSLGGVHDEAEIRGHRRTYIGALPGNIIQAIRKAGTRNCVMMLDEIDKLGAGIQGDPAAALLEVLDPEQNNTFRDNYLGVPFDLSRVVFITTANMLDTIPGPLRDRMEIISLAGYTAEEKLQIARRYLVRRQLEANGLKPDRSRSTTRRPRHHPALHARGGRAQPRARDRPGAAPRRRADRRGQSGPIRIGRDDLAAILGAPQFENEVAMRTSVPGVATGLAWTPVGGDILFIEATRMPGTGRLILTGQLGDVMRESAQAALSHRQEPRRRARHRRRPLREERHPRPRAGRRHPEGRPERRRRHVHGAGLADDRPHGAQRHRDDRRDQPARPGAAGRRHQGEGRRRASAGLKRVMLPARNRQDFEDIPEMRAATGVRLARAGRRRGRRGARAGAGGRERPVVGPAACRRRGVTVVAHGFRDLLATTCN